MFRPFALTPENRWIPAAVGITAAYAVACAALPMGFDRTIFGDVTLFLLVAAATAAMALNIRVSHGHVRAFWLLMTIGCVMWATLEGIWLWFEIIHRVPVPRPSGADAIFFMRLVPFIAAVGLQPHARWETPYRPGMLDLALLLCWWVFLYVFIVAPWQYVVHDDVRYFRNHDMLYLVGRILFLAMVVAAWRYSRGAWHTIYGHLLVATVLYFASSIVISNAIEANKFHTGSYYELFLVATLCWHTGVGWTAWRLRPASDAKVNTDRLTVWSSRATMAAVLSVPVVAFWGIADFRVPAAVRDLRMFLALGAMLVLCFLLYLKQHFFELELLQALRESRDSLENTTRLQAQLLHSEKLASLGRLVAGAAHEINNPLTVILGYSDILANDPEIAAGSREMALKIREHGRRTKVLIENLLSFARQSPGQKTLLDPNLVLENATRLREVDLPSRKVRLHRELGQGLPHVWADEYKLLEVCLHILNNSVDALTETGGGEIRVRSRVNDGVVVLEFQDDGPGIGEPERIFDPFYTTKSVGKGAGLGLSACYGIIKDHGGEIVCRNRTPKGAVFEVRLPANYGRHAAGAGTSK